MLLTCPVTMVTVMPLKLAVASSISQLVQSEATLITTNHDIVRAPEGGLDLTLSIGFLVA